MGTLTRFDRWRRAAMASAALLALVAMAPVLANAFTSWDDADTIYRNWRITPPGAQGLWAHWTSAHMSLYVPVTYTVWAAVSALSHAATGTAHAAFFHAASLLLHMAAAAAVCGLAITLLDDRATPVRGGRAAPADPRPMIVAALCGAIVFAIHPVQVESVAWASGLKDVLMGLLAILSLWALARAQQAWDHRPRRQRLLTLAAVLLVLAMLSKPTAVIVPLMGAVVLWMLQAPLRRIGAITGVGLALALPFVIIARWAQPAYLAIDGGPLWARPLIAADAYAFYLWKLIWPVALAPDYGRSPPAVMASGTHLWAWMVPLALAAVLWMARGRVPLIAGGMLLAAIPIVPVSGIATFEFQQYSTVSDHYLYLCLAGLAIATAGIVQQLSRKQARLRRPLAAVAVGLAVMMVVQDWRQARRWEDSQAIFTHTLAVNPRSYAACNNLATIALEQGRLDDAVSMAQRALEAKGGYVHALVTLGNALHLRGDPAGAEAAYRDALAASANDPMALSNFGGLLAEQGRIDEAMGMLRRAVQVDPDLGPAQLNLGTLLAMAGRSEEAERHLRAAVRINPRDPKALTNLAIVLLDAGRAAEASTLLQQALAIDPEFAPARNVLGGG